MRASRTAPATLGAPRRVGAKATLASAFLIALGALALSACSGGGPGAHRARAAGTSAGNAASTAGARGLAAAARPAAMHACERVRAPARRTGERAPKPSRRLDPARTYEVTLSTSCGPIVIRLDVRKAPRTSASFASLVSRGFYDHLTFHRVIPGYIIQGGDPNGDGTGGPGYTIVERPPHGFQYTRGVVAMAKTGTEPDGTSGSQFFIVTAANTALPAQYALVGSVVAGQGTLAAISAVPRAAGPDGDESTPRDPIVIERATLAVS